MSDLPVHRNVVADEWVKTTAKQTNLDHMQFHPTHKLVILSGAPDRCSRDIELVARSRRTSAMLILPMLREACSA